MNRKENHSTDLFVLFNHHFFRLKNEDRALACFENALTQNPNNADARASMGMIYQLKGCTAKAIHAYHQALANSPNDLMIQELLDVSLEINSHTSYRDTYPLLEDTFDIFQMADSLQHTTDEVDMELNEAHWVDKTVEMTKEKDPARHIEAMIEEESVLKDEGDLIDLRQKWL